MIKTVARNVALLTAGFVIFSPNVGTTQEMGERLLQFILDAKEAKDNPLAVVVTPGNALKVTGITSVTKAAGPALAVGSAALNGKGMVEDYMAVTDYAEKRRAGTATMEDAANAGKTFESFAQRAGVDGGPAVGKIIGAAAGGVLQVDQAAVCRPRPQCTAEVLQQLELNRERYRSSQIEEYSSKNLIMKGMPASVANAANLAEGAVDTGTSIADRIAPAVDRATTAVGNRAAAVGNWLVENSAATFNNVKTAAGFGGAQDAQPVVTAPVQLQTQTQTTPQAVPSAVPTAAPAAPSVISKAPQQIVVPRQQATATTRQVPTSQPIAPTAAPARPQPQPQPQPQASTQPIASPAPKPDSPWQQQQRADAAAAAAIAAERPAGLSQGQPAIGGIQSDKIWYDGSEGFGGFYELDPKLKAQQAIDYTEKNYAEAVSVDGQPFGMQPSPDPFGDLVPDAADAIQPEDPVQNRDVPPEPVEQAGADDENFDSLSSDPDPYNAPVRQPKYDGYTRPGPGRGDRCGPGQLHAAPVDTPFPAGGCW